MEAIFSLLFQGHTSFWVCIGMIIMVVSGFFYYVVVILDSIVVHHSWERFTMVGSLFIGGSLFFYSLVKNAQAIEGVTQREVWGAPFGGALMVGFFGPVLIGCAVRMYIEYRNGSDKSPLLN